MELYSTVNSVQNDAKMFDHRQSGSW